jgi:phage tail-like protein
VVRELEPGATILDGDGAVIGSSEGPEGEIGAFPALPFLVDRDGNLDLGPLCSPPTTKRFSLYGVELPPAVFKPIQSFETSGSFTSGPLDSQVYRCVWHRVVILGSIPKTARVRVSTFTSEAALPAEHLELPGVVWAANPAPMRNVNGEWDCLIPSPAGRYLWLRLELKADGYSTPVLQEIRLEFPRISLRRYLPAVFGDEPVSANFTDRFLSIFDTTLRSIEKKIDQGTALYDPLSAPATIDRQTGTDALSWLASWIGVTLERHWSEQRRREWLKRAGEFLCMRGTPEGLRRQLALLLGMDCARNCCPQEMVCRKKCRPVLNCATPECRPAWDIPPLILEHFKLRRWLYVGSGRIGDQAELWGRSIVNRSQLGNGAQADVSKLVASQDPLRDPFHVTAHRYSVFVPACWARNDAQRRSLLNLLRSETPAHTQGQIEYVEPRFRIGIQSTVGLNSVVGRYPSGGDARPEQARRLVRAECTARKSQRTGYRNRPPQPYWRNDFVELRETLYASR